MIVPERPKIYHITHVENLPSIISDGMLISDHRMIDQGGPDAAIGMSRIKHRRLKLPISCHPPDFVGDYVPFCYCPRSVMLCVIWYGNDPDLTYRGGQGPIVHLEADLYAVMDWADAEQRRWAISLTNAGAYYTEFRCLRHELEEVDWTAVGATDFRAEEIKERKQAEFLLRIPLAAR